MRKLVLQAASNESCHTVFKSEPTFVKKGVLWEIGRADIMQENESFRHFLEDTLPALTKKVLLLMGLNRLNVEVKPVFQHLVVCGTGSSAMFSQTPSNGNEQNKTECYVII